MKAALLSSFSVALFAAGSVAQTVIPIPPHSTVYNGFSRGLNYTSNVNHIITNLDLPPEAQQAGDTASYMVRVNGVEVLRSTGNAGAISSNLLVFPGDVVDVFGNWSPAAPTNFTAHNSYGSSAPYATTIEGVAHTLNRVGWQYDIGSPSYTAGAYLPPATGSLGRTFVTTTPQAGLFASFTSDVVSGSSPLTVNFQDTTFTSDPGGVISWAWDFDNDGVVDSTDQNPVHTYSACGVYDVSLTVTDATNPPSTETAIGYITTDTVAADFTFALLAANTVQFTDATTPAATSWAWDFDGDGVTDSTAQNPVHVYPAGTAVVECSLVASRLCGPADTKTQQLIPTTHILTTFAGGNGLTSSGAGNVFDITVNNPLGITVTDIIMSPWVVTPGPFTIDVYLTEDDSGYASNHANAAAWRLVATGSATTTTTATSGAPTLVGFPLAQRLHIAPGNYSMAIHVNGGGVVYTTGNGTNQNFSNADVTLNLGGGKSFPFSASVFQPRIWNGALLYDDCAIGGLAGYGYLGNGCANSLGAVSGLSSTSAPTVGGTLSVDVDNLPQDVAIMVLGWSTSSSVFGPLPFDLTGLGAPGCFGLVSPDSNTLLIGSAGTATYTLSIPNLPALVCAPIYNQALVLDGAANALGAVMSDAGTGIVGN
jgi:PKD repeat protein